jgi:ribonuclease HIII
MTLFIGTDEAGYGPNLGPLMICATAWRVPDARPTLDLYQRLSAVVSKTPAEQTIAIADSKVLYHSNGGLASLECGVFASLGAIGNEVSTWRQVWLQIVPRLCMDAMECPWHREYDEPLPIDASPEILRALVDRLREGLAQANVCLHAVEADAVFPHEFNELVKRYQSKGELLSTRTLELVQRLWQSTDDAMTVVQCDKHGGRNNYVPILQTLFPEYLVEVRRESRATSIYRWGAPGRRIEFHFSAKGERYLPAALSSMFAKYLRELAMRAFNAFWQSHAVGLKPTAGYSVDARRFVTDIAAKQRELAIEDHLLWRCR